MQKEEAEANELPDFQNNDHWLARLFHHAFEGQIYFTPSRKWILFDGKRFVQDSGDTIVGKMGEFLDFEARLGAERGDDKAVLKYLNAAQCDKKIKAALSIAKYYFFDDDSTWDKDPTLFNCNNGTINLATGKLQPHDFRDKITHISPVDFLGEKAPRENIEKFLSELFNDPEMTAMCRRLIGYFLTGLTSEDAIFFMYGTGLNGKSTLCNLLIDMMGDYAAVANIETFLSQKRSSSGPSSDLARLAGSRFVVAGEPGVRSQLDESIIKRLCGGDKLIARFGHAKEFMFEQTFKIAIHYNNAPEIIGADDGTWRRIYPITFPNKFYRNEEFRVALKKELSGLLYIATQGAQEWFQNRLGMPGEVMEKAAEYRRTSDPFGSFIEDECHLDETIKDQSTTLFNAYCEWAKQNNEETISHKRFSMTLQERGFKVKHEESGNVFIGIAKKSHSYQQAF